MFALADTNAIAANLTQEQEQHLKNDWIFFSISYYYLIYFLVHFLVTLSIMKFYNKTFKVTDSLIHMINKGYSIETVRKDITHANRSQFCPSYG